MDNEGENERKNSRLFKEDFQLTFSRPIPDILPHHVIYSHRSHNDFEKPDIQQHSRPYSIRLQNFYDPIFVFFED